MTHRLPIAEMPEYWQVWMPSVKDVAVTPVALYGQLAMTVVDPETNWYVVKLTMPRTPLTMGRKERAGLPG